jgi:hypothetical protein
MRASTCPGSILDAAGPPRSAGVRLALGALGVLALAAGACTKVQEQPVLQAPPPEARPAPPPPPKAAKPAKARWGFDAPAPPRRQADPQPAVASDTLNGDPNGLKREDLQKTLDAAMPRFTSCFDSATGSVNVSLTFDAGPDGKPDNVKVAGGGSTADRCVATVVNGLRLPTFSGKPVPVSFPLSIQRTVTQTTAPKKPPLTTDLPNNTGRLASPPMFIRP